MNEGAIIWASRSLFDSHVLCHAWQSVSCATTSHIKVIVSIDNKVADYTVRMHGIICAFVVHMQMACPISHGKVSFAKDMRTVP